MALADAVSAVNIISPKVLERQLKVCEDRIDALKAELTELEKIRQVCQSLLGEELASTDSLDESNSRKKKRKAAAKGQSQSELNSQDSGEDSLAIEAMEPDSDAENRASH